MTTATPTDVIACLRGVGVTYGRAPRETVALDGVDATIRRGAMVAITGPSGSGKTTLCNVLAGWEHPDRGTLIWARDLDDPASWSIVATVPQRLGLLDMLTIRENVALPLAIGDSAVDVVAHVDRVLADLDLLDVAERRPAETSLGQQQRAAIARAVVVEPHVVVLDEPTGHQDEDSVDRILRTLSSVRAAGTTVIVATHDERVVNTADDRLPLRDGRPDTSIEAA